MERQFENRNLKLENCDMPPKKSIFPENRISLPQCPQCQPLVSNRLSIGPSAQGPSTEGVLRHGGVPRQSSIGTLAREPCLQGVQCHPRVPKGASCRSSSRPPCQQMPQWHPRGATVSWLSDSSRIGLREIHLARAIIDYQVVSYPKGAR